MKHRLLKFSIVALVALLCALDYGGVFGYRGDDWKHFDHQTVRMLRVISGDTFAIADGTIVHVMGVDAPQKHGAEQSTQYLAARLKDRDVTLRLDGTQTRDDAGNLLAYVYVTVGDCVNVDVVRDGQAFADRRIKHSQQPAIEQVENDARKKHRGMWNGLRDEDQPQWRRDWLEALRNRRRGN